MHNRPDGLKARSLLATFEDESGVDPRCYYATVANSLLGRFGARAIHVASDAIQKMRLLGDEDGRLMWEGVSEQIADRLDFGPAPLPALH